jgi:hypothetical protein
MLNVRGSYITESLGLQQAGLVTVVVRFSRLKLNMWPLVSKLGRVESAACVEM